MKIGTKFGNEDYDYSYLTDHNKFDFVELFVVPGGNHRGLEAYDLPVVIHCAHYGYDVNFADSKKRDKNLIALEEAIKVADYYKSEKIIFHPELIDNNTSSKEVLIDFIKENYDKRLLLENMPSSRVHFAKEVEDIRELIKIMNVGFCLDFGHAATFAFAEKLDFQKYLKQLMELGPNHFHASDTRYVLQKDGTCTDQHMTIGTGNIDFEYVRSILSEKDWVTLETPKDSELQIDELNFFKASGVLA